MSSAKRFASVLTALLLVSVLIQILPAGGAPDSGTAAPTRATRSPDVDPASGTGVLANENARILLHVGPTAAKSACTAGLPATCEQAVIHGDLSVPYFVYVVASEYLPELGLSAAQFGISYQGAAGQGVDVLAWTSCAALEFPDDAWPGSGTGNLVTWDAQGTDPVTGCQHDEVAVAGYFYMQAYSADRLDLTPRPVDGQAKVADCESQETTLPPGFLGSAGFGDGVGRNPCTEPWSPVSLSGRVVDGLDAGLAGVHLTGLTYTVLTDADGYYTALLDSGWSGTVTPVHEGYAFTPASRVYEPLTASRSGEDYTAERLGPIRIGGVVSLPSALFDRGIVGIEMTGLPGPPFTDPNGYYYADVPHGWSGTVTPALPLHEFSPASRTYTNVTEATPGEHFIAYPLLNVSGRARDSAGEGIPGVVMDGLPGPPVTGADGRFLVTVRAGYTATVRPQKSGYEFQPDRRSVGADDNVGLPDFVGTPVEHYQRYLPLRPKLLVHVGGSAPGSPCVPAALSDCDSAATTGGLSPAHYFVYVLAGSYTRTNGIGRAEFGVDYAPGAGDGVDVLSWTLCAGSELPDPGWPAAGTGNVVRWDAPQGDPNGACQKDALAVAGYFYLTSYSPDAVAITPRPATQIALAADCMGVEHPLHPTDLGRAGFGGTAGLNPCAERPLFLSGHVRTPEGDGVAGVEMRGFASPTVTDTAGAYSAAIDMEWDGLVEPILPGHLFSPVERVYAGVTSSLPAEDFVAAPLGVGDPKLCVHLGRVRFTCEPDEVRTCADVAIFGEVAKPYFAYLLAGNYDRTDGVAGLEFGISYDGAPGQGVEVFAWRLCGAAEKRGPGWPASGSGITVQWDPDSPDPERNCRQESVAIAGYLYLSAYTADVLSIIPHPQKGAARVKTCASTDRVVDPFGFGSAGFGPGPGLNPCRQLQVPVRLLSFSGARQSDGVRLEWRIGEASDLLGFHVDREEVGAPEVPPVRITQRIVSWSRARERYQLIDETAIASTSYRYTLIALGLDGSTEILGTTALGAGSPGPLAFRVRALSNPVRGPAHLGIEGAPSGRARVAVLDVRGRVVRDLGLLEVPDGAREFEWDARDGAGRAVASGVYFIRVEAAGKVRETKLVLAR